MPRNWDQLGWSTRSWRQAGAAFQTEWLTEPGVEVQVQVVDGVSGQKLWDETVSKEWRSWHHVHEVILFARDMLQVDLWEDIAVYQGGTVIQESVPLGCLVDDYRTVYLTVKRVTVFFNPDARLALSKASVCADAKKIPAWHEWMKKARELENIAKT